MSPTAVCVLVQRVLESYTVYHRRLRPAVGDVHPRLLGLLP